MNAQLEAVSQNAATILRPTTPDTNAKTGIIKLGKEKKLAKKECEE